MHRFSAVFVLATALLCSVALAQIPYLPSQPLQDALAIKIGRYSPNNTASNFDNPWRGHVSVALAFNSFAGDRRTDARVLQIIRSALVRGGDIVAAGGYPLQFELNLVGAVAIARQVPRLWSNFSATEQRRLELIVRTAAISAAFASNDNNPFRLSLVGRSFARNGTSHIRSAPLAVLFAASVFYGGDLQLSRVVSNYNYTAHVAELRANGHVNALATYRLTSTGAPTSGQLVAGLRNWSWRAANATLTRLMNAFMADGNRAVSKTVSAGLNNGAGVRASNGAIRGRIVSGASALPNAGAIGMYEDLDTRDSRGPRSSYVMSTQGHRVWMSWFALALASRRLDRSVSGAGRLVRRFNIAVTDLQYKAQRGYLSYANGGPPAKENEDFSTATHSDSHALRFMFSQWFDVLKPAFDNSPSTRPAPPTSPSTPPRTTPSTPSRFIISAVPSTTSGILPLSTRSTLLVAILSGVTLPSGAPRILARSYGGNPWELVAGASDIARVSCTGSNCTISTTGRVQTRQYSLPAGFSLSPVSQAASWYAQGGFGAPLSVLQSTATQYGSDVGRWVRDQQNLPATLVRPYFRKRNNPRAEATNDFDHPKTMPCSNGGRWYPYVLEMRDYSKNLTVLTNLTTRLFDIRINGVLRAEIPTFFGRDFPATAIRQANNTRVPWTICEAEEGLGSTIRLVRFGAACNDGSARVEFPQPAMNIVNTRLLGRAFQAFPDRSLMISSIVGGRNGAIIVRRMANCTIVPDAQGNAYMRYQGRFYRFDQRLIFENNLVEAPSAQGPAGDDQCPIAPSSISTRDKCAFVTGCPQPPQFLPVDVPLTHTTLRAWYTDSSITRNYVYAVDGLRLEGEFAQGPCATATSRWLRLNTGGCAGGPSALAANVVTRIRSVLTTTTDKGNPLLRDVTVSGTADCPRSIAAGIRVEADGACWQHVHPEHLNVHDATEWVNIHDGNSVVLATKGYNPIAKFAVDGLSRLTYPLSHDMGRWALRRPLLPFVGRFGDNVTFTNLPSSLRTISMANRFRALDTPSTNRVLACGSSGEVSNDPVLGDHYLYTPNRIGGAAGQAAQQLEFNQIRDEQIPAVIMNVMFSANDTLRQRVAWALSNFIVSSTTAAFFTDRPEGHLQFYDIFIRNAFGNFEKLLTEVSYAPIMARWLTYHGSRSFASTGSFADENYAREIMQLFSLGLNKMNLDGTPILDANGNPLPTYTNEDIIDYARVWTGFFSAPRRSNLFDMAGESFVDELQIASQHRDRFPKTMLDRGGYLGDGYPLCDEMPSKPWLRAGATFYLIGGTSNEGRGIDNSNDRRGRFSPSNTSALFRALCARPSASAACTFPTKVVLPNAITCSGQDECQAEQVFSIRVFDPVSRQTVYYRIQRPPCVRMAFFSDGRVLQEGSIVQCGNPMSPRAQPACCPASSPSNPTSSFGNECLFANDHTTYATAQARCQAQGLVLCAANSRISSWASGRVCSQRGTSWTTRSCSLKIQVNGNGRVGIIDPLATSGMFVKNTNNVFRAFWRNNTLPLPVNRVCPAGCVVENTLGGPTCICDFTVSRRTIFSETGLTGVTLRRLETTLALGAWPPTEYPAGTYSRCTLPACTALASSRVVVWTRGSPSVIDSRTIFELPPRVAGGAARFFLNLQETVNVGSAFAFRNPPAFMPLVGYNYIAPGTEAHLAYSLFANDAAEWETLALVRHLVENPNTPPYVCTSLMKNMITSNPSPRYVRRCTSAFMNGGVDGITFSGKYGDLGAAVYAIMTDREARSSLLLADPTFGMIVDPLVSILRVLRSLEYESPRRREITLPKYPMVPLNAPSVFNYYPADFQPDGTLAESNLIAPQLELFTPFTAISLLNGLNSLAQNGLTACNGGFGDDRLGRLSGRVCSNVASRRNSSDGVLTYQPATATANQIVQDMSTLLTAGRVHPGSVTWKQAVAAFSSSLPLSSNIEEITRIFFSSPEFFSTTLSTPTAVRQPSAPVIPSSRARIKNIYLHEMAGGLDSWNVLVPLGNCGSRDMYRELEVARAGGLLPKSRYLRINVPNGTQPCTVFGIHDAMPALKRMYDAGEALFFSNIGALIEPITADDVQRGRGRIPPSLFAHNIMRRSTNTLDPERLSAHGILGRARDAIHTQTNRMNTLMASFEGVTFTLRGASNYEVMSDRGVTLLNTSPAARTALGAFTANRTENFIVSEFTRSVGSAIESSARINDILRSVSLSGPGFSMNSSSSREAELASRLVAFARRNSTDRTAFFSQSGGYDTHATFDLDDLLKPVDVALSEFRREMIAQGVWNDTVIVVTTEFARTLQSNGQGSDHGWGGHTFIIGGKVRGGRILGEYPTSLSEDHPQMMSRGRLVPTFPYEAIWNGVLRWYGVQDPALSQAVLPNLANFPRTKYYTQADLFRP